MLISIGEILVDIFKDGSHESVYAGGAPFNVAVNSLLYTKDVYFVGCVGKDTHGEFLQNFANNYTFVKKGIKTHESRCTSKAIVTLDNGERYFKFDRDFGADYAININDIDFSIINSGDIVHIGSLMLSHKEGREFFNQLINKIREIRGVYISFDINYRDDIFESSDAAKKIFVDALKQADILKFSEDELLFLSGKDNIKEALDFLLNEQQIAVITLGSKGSMLYKDRKLTKVNTYPLKSVDTTGAGDAFYSYFLSSLNNDFDFVNEENKVRNILLRANIVGGIATLKKGAIGVAPSEKQIDLYLINKK